jgi:phosphohistidine phosphatase
VGKEMGHEEEPVVDNALRPEATLPDFQKLLEKHGRQESIMVVGHNPNLSEFLGRAIGGAAIELKKGAVAKVEMAGDGGSLSWCVTPRILRTLYAAATESSRPKTSRK